MDLQRWINRTLEIQAIPAPTFDEAERASYVEREFAAAQLADLHRDQQGNVYGRAPGGDGPPLLVSAHLDTVFAHGTDLRARRTRGRIVGPGIGDNAVGLGALLELANDLAEKPLASEVWLVANVGEEGLGNLCGMREVVGRFGDQISAYIVLEGMALGHVYHRALPIRRYRITASTEGGHSWIHLGRASAIHALIQVGARLLQISLPRVPKTTLNIGTVHGGRSINSIADLATMELDLRSESLEVLEQVERDVQQLVREQSRLGPDLELELVGSRPDGELPAKHPLVQAAVEALASVGEQPFLEAGSTDASIPLHRGLPAVCVGVTKGGEAHTTSEYIELRPLSTGYQALRHLLQHTDGVTK